MRPAAGGKMKYQQVRKYTDQEILNILNYGTDEELKILPLSVGEFHLDYQYAQDVCFLLLQNSNEDIRANAILGLSYIARRYGTLNIEKLKELLAGRQSFSTANTGRVEDALEDISLFLNENIELKL